MRKRYMGDSDSRIAGIIARFRRQGHRLSMKFTNFVAVMIDQILYRFYDSPAGRLMLAEWKGVPAVCSWLDTPSHNAVLKAMRRNLGAEFAEADSAVLTQMATWLDGYFSGANPDVPDVLITGSDFSRRVLHTLCLIPYGTTVSYSRLARMAGVPTATRAVASAVAANPLSLFVPCHRVIRSDGTPGLYTGLDDSKKRYLLTLESAQLSI